LPTSTPLTVDCHAIPAGRDAFKAEISFASHEDYGLDVTYEVRDIHRYERSLCQTEQETFVAIVTILGTATGDVLYQRREAVVWNKNDGDSKSGNITLDTAHPALKPYAEDLGELQEQRSADHKQAVATAEARFKAGGPLVDIDPKAYRVTHVEMTEIARRYLEVQAALLIRP
jgi:hypothetical protein